MRHAFDAALDAIGREDFEPPPPIVVKAPAARLAASPASAGAAHSLWESAAAWTPEADPPPPRAARPAPPPPSADPADVAAALQLTNLKTARDVARARRRFMWDNHPDRLRGVDPLLAGRRVAIANMLLDRALKALAAPRR